MDYTALDAYDSNTGSDSEDLETPAKKSRRDDTTGVTPITEVNSVEPWRPKRFREREEPTLYSSRCLGFVSKIRDPNPHVGLPPNIANVLTRYVFRDGIHKPLFCPKLNDIKMPHEARVPMMDPRQMSQEAGSYHRAVSNIRFIKDKTNWGFDPLSRSIQTKAYIPCNFEDMHEQQQMMTPVIHFINSHPEVLEEVKPNFVCNRFIMKKIMLLDWPLHSFNFLAEKKDGIIYLREMYDAKDSDHQRTSRKPGKIATNAFISANGSPEDDSPIDSNEAVYGAYVGQVGPDIKVLFTAEIDAFWSPDGDESDEEAMATNNMQNRILELKTTRQHLWTKENHRPWQTVVANTFVQCFLVGAKDVLCAVLLGSGIVCQFLQYNTNLMVDYLKDHNHYPEGNQESFYVKRLEAALSTIWKTIDEDTPSLYGVVVSQYEGLEMTTVVTKITNFNNFPNKK